MQEMEWMCIQGQMTPHGRRGALGRDEAPDTGSIPGGPVRVPGLCALPCSPVLRITEVTR